MPLFSDRGAERTYSSALPAPRSIDGFVRSSAADPILRRDWTEPLQPEPAQFAGIRAADRRSRRNGSRSSHRYAVSSIEAGARPTASLVDGSAGL